MKYSTRTNLLYLLLMLLVFGAHAQTEFITTWQTTSTDESITIPTTGSGYDYTVDWGDTNSDMNVAGDANHTYTAPGTYFVTITGDFPRIYFNNSGDKDKILTIEQWGDVEWASMAQAFYGCLNLTIPATDAPDLTNVTTTNQMLADATSFNEPINHWDVSSITDMQNMFFGASLFNQNLNNWDVSNVQNMYQVFGRATNFNGNITNWDVSQVTNMIGTFAYCENFNQDLSSWNVGLVEDMSYMFRGTKVFNQPLDSWDVGNVTSMISMFNGAAVFNQGIGSWDVSMVTSMNSMFNGAAVFNQDLNSWNVGEVTNMGGMFNFAKVFNGDISNWNVTKVNSMNQMFRGSESFNQNIGNWDVSGVTNMSELFFNAKAFNQDISGWDVSNVQFMPYTFYGMQDFNQDISSWDVSQVTNMKFMFASTGNFDQDLSGWNVGLVEDMSYMFRGAKEFNQPLDSWDVSNVTTMANMFESAELFDQVLSSWDVSSVTAMSKMFYFAKAFDQSLSDWDVSNVTTMSEMFNYSGFSKANYDKTLNGWSALTLKSDVPFGVLNIKYCHGADAREVLINTFNWDITDGGQECKAFVTTWETMEANERIAIPTEGGGYDYSVDWGDGTEGTDFTGDTSHIYTSPGIYTVSITGDFPRIYFNNEGDKDKILTIEQWGDTEWATMEKAFFGCSNLTSNASDAPNLTGVTTLEYMFSSATSFNGDLNNWDLQHVTNLNSTFSNAESFTGSIGNWDVSNVTTMRLTFADASSFNSDMGSWDVSSVEDFWGMFFRANSFNQDLNDWDLSSAQSIQIMFGLNTAFNGDVTQWDVSNVSNFGTVFTGATAFNRDITGWDMSSATRTDGMFNSAVAFNQDLSAWDVSGVTNMLNMFNGSGMSSRNYDNILNSWSQLTLQSGVDFGATGISYCNGSAGRAILTDTYNWDISDGGETCASFVTTWKTDNVGDSDDNQITIPTEGGGYDFHVDWGDDSSDNNVTGDITHTYASPGSYTVTISGDFPRIYFNDEGDKEKLLTIEQWGDNPWQTMEGAFYGCARLTIPAEDSPNLENVTDMSLMLARTDSFNQNINHWDVSNVTDMGSLFFRAVTFNQPLDNWDVSGVTDLTGTFSSAYEFDQDLSSWDVSSVVTLQTLFFRAYAFNGDISTWDVSNVKTLRWAFLYAYEFDQDLSNWDVSQVINMSRTFTQTSFNQDISNWDVSKVTIMDQLFSDTPFNHDLGAWDVSNVTNMAGMFSNSGFTKANYDNTLRGWSALTLKLDVSLGVGNVTYCHGANAHEILTGTYNWEITDGGPECNAFVTTWETTEDDERIAIPTEGGGYDYSVDWGDGTEETDITGDTSHIYTSPGVYTVSITGDFPRIYFNNEGDKDKILTIEQWGDAEWTTMEKAFFGCSNLTSNASDAPNLTGVTSLESMFASAISFNGDLNNWDVSKVTNLNSTFSDAESFTGNVGDWDVSNVTTMRLTFADASNFNSDIASWDVSGVEDFWGMFFRANSFNQDLNDWDLSSAQSIQIMFAMNTAFNGDITQWDVSNISNFGTVFSGASAFNQDISSWDMSSATRTDGMFNNARDFDQDLSAWDMSGVTNMLNMFNNSGLSRENYDVFLEGLATQTLQENVAFGAEGIVYCDGATARASVIDNFNWTFTDGGEDCSIFIPDANFKAALLANTAINTVDDGEITYSEAEAFNGAISVSDLGIADLTGIEEFMNISSLIANDNDLTSLDLSNNNQLTSVQAFNNELTSVDLTGLTALRSLNFTNSSLESIDLSALSELNTLYLVGNALPTIDLSNNDKLTTVAVQNNELGALDLSNNPDVQGLYAQDNNLSILDLSNNPDIRNLFLGNNDLTSLDLSSNPLLVDVRLMNNQLTSLDFTSNTVLEKLFVDNNPLTALNVQNGNNTSITTFVASGNPDLSCVTVDDVEFSQTNWTGIDDATSFSTDCNNVANAILTFELEEQIAGAIFDNDNHQIAIEVAPGTDLTSLTPVMTLSSGASIDPELGSSQDFTNPVTYSVTAENPNFIQDWMVTVSEQNAAPTAINLDEDELAENNEINAIIGSLTTEDVNTSDSHAYSLVEGDGALDNTSFVISGNELLANEQFDFENKSTYSIRIRTQDEGDSLFEAILFIHITDANDTPTDLLIDNNEIDENEASGSSIGSFTSADQDITDTHTYSLISGDGDDDNASFDIVGSELLTAEIFNYEVQSAYSIRVNSNDGNGGVFEKQFEIIINDLNEGVVVANAIEDQDYDEGFNSATIDLSGVFTDGDGDVLALTATSSDEAVATVAMNNSTLTITEAGLGTTTVTVTADDGNGESVSDAFEVTVNNVNEAPVVANAIEDQDYDEGFGSSTIDLSGVFTDGDGDDLSLTATSSDEAVATVAISNSTLTITEVGLGTTTVTVTASDGNGESVSDEFEVIVNNVNEAPVVANAIEDQDYDEGFGSGAIDLSGVFTDGDGDVLTLTATSSDEAVATAVIDGFKLTVTEVGLGTTTVTVTADDGNGESVSDAFEVTVNNVNEAPVVALAIEDQTYDEGFGSGTIDLSGVFTDGDGDELTLTATSTDEAVSTVAIDGFKLTILEVGLGTTTVTVTADDGNGESVSDEFKVTVNNVNEAPVVALAIEDQAYDEGFNSATIDLSGVFTDGDGDELTLTATSSDEAVATVAIDGFKLTITEVGLGTTTVTVTADDGNGESVSDEFEVTVNNVNEAPVVANAIEDQAYDEGFGSGAIDLSGVFTDGDGDDLTLTATSSDETVATVTIDGFKLTILEVGLGTTTVTVTADDGNGESVSDKFEVTVNNVNEAPVVANAIEDQAYDEGFGSGTIDLSGVFTDGDGDDLTLTATSSDETVATVAIDGFKLTITEVGLGTTTVTVTADDGNGESVSDEFEVTVNNVNEAPVVANAIEDQTYDEGFGSATIDLSGVFTDGDGDALALSVISSDEAIATVAIDGFKLTITEVGLGATTVTVTADDGNGESVSDEFEVTINNVNEAPVVANAIEDQAYDEGFVSATIDLSGVFTDGDGDDLTLSVISSDETVATVAIDGFKLTITEVGLGTTTVTVTANDGNGESVSDEFEVTVNNVNEAPVVANAIEDQAYDEGFVSATIDLSGVFTDGDGDALALSVISSDESVATVAIDGFKLTVTEVGLGTTTVTVTADDGNGGSVSDAFVAEISAILSKETDILSFELVSQTGPAIVDNNNHSVSIEVKAGTELASLTPKISVSAGATVDPESSAVLDFTDPVLYSVTAEDGVTTQDWKVTVTVEELILSKPEEITFSIYPNPATDYIRFRLPGEVTSIQLFNAEGKLAITQYVDQQMDVSELPHGLYFILIQSESQLIKRKIIIQ